MPKFIKGNTAFLGAKGQGKSSLPTDIPTKYDEGFLDGMDGRRPIPRQLKQRLGELVSNLGGLDNLSYQEQSLCKRAIHLERVIEVNEAILVNGGMVDMNIYLSCVNSFCALLGKLGLKRRAKSISLKDYLSSQPAPSGPQPKEETDGSESDHRRV